MNGDHEDDESPGDPTLILGVSTTDGTPTDNPLFAAVHLTQELVDRLQMLSDLCRTHGLASVSILDVDPPVYWDTLPGGVVADLEEVEMLWHVDGPRHWATLRGSRPQVEGGYGEVQDIAHTMVVDVSEFQRWRDEGYLIAFSEFPDHEDALGEPFAPMFLQRVAELRLWPMPGVVYETGSADDEEAEI